MWGSNSQLLSGTLHQVGQPGAPPHVFLYCFSPVLLYLYLHQATIGSLSIIIDYFEFCRIVYTWNDTAWLLFFFSGLISFTQQNYYEVHPWTLLDLHTVYLFSLLSSTPLYEYATVCLCCRLSLDLSSS